MSTEKDTRHFQQGRHRATPSRHRHSSSAWVITEEANAICGLVKTKCSIEPSLMFKTRLTQLLTNKEMTNKSLKWKGFLEQLGTRLDQEDVTADNLLQVTQGVLERVQSTVERVDPIKSLKERYLKIVSVLAPKTHAAKRKVVYETQEQDVKAAQINLATISPIPLLAMAVEDDFNITTQQFKDRIEESCSRYYCKGWVAFIAYPLTDSFRKHEFGVEAIDKACTALQAREVKGKESSEYTSTLSELGLFGKQAAVESGGPPRSDSNRKYGCGFL